MTGGQNDLCSAKFLGNEHASSSARGISHFDIIVSFIGQTGAHDGPIERLGKLSENLDAKMTGLYEIRCQILNFKFEI